MPSPSSSWVTFGLLALSAKGSFGGDHHPHSSYLKDSRLYTVIDTTTILASTTIEKTHYVDVTVPHYVNITVKSTKTESTTVTLSYTVSTTETDSATITNTETDSATVTNTETDSATITNTQTTTDTVPATVTTYTTKTIMSTTVDPCPKTCSISAGTVNLFFWPPSRPYTYPSTYVDTALAYTFVSPSVYMLIPTAVGTNSAGRAGPSTSSWMLDLDLDEVSTIDGTVTRQLNLGDLGTDCPQTAEPSAIATMVDSRCDPILAAPKQVSSWAYPCNACGRFGLFDPPYAVPTLTGGLTGTTSAAPVPTTSIVASSTVIASSAPSSAPSSPVTSSLSPTTTAVVSPTSVVTASATRAKSGLGWLIASILISVVLL